MWTKVWKHGVKTRAANCANYANAIRVIGVIGGSAFQLQMRLFRYPLSYMVYSDVFNGMPDAARQRVYQRLFDVLSGKDTSRKFARLAAGNRRSVLEILRDTKPGLPAYWKTSG